MKHLLRVLAAAPVMTVCVLGCGEWSPRRLPISDFSLTTGQVSATGGINPLMLHDDTLTFHYKGSEELKEVDLTIEVWYSNGDKPTYTLYQGFWKPNTDKGVRLDQTFAGKPQKVILSGKARVGQEAVEIGVRWLLGDETQ